MAAAGGKRAADGPGSDAKRSCPSPRGGGEVCVFLRRPAGDVVSVDLPADATVRDLRERAREACDGGEREVVLRFGGQRLDDDAAALADSGVAPQATINVELGLITGLVGRCIAAGDDGGARDLSYHDLTLCQFDTRDLRGWRFNGAKLRMCNFFRCDLREALFDAATEFAGGVFRSAQLPAGLDLRGQSLALGVFDECDMRAALFDATTEFAGGSFRQVQFPASLDLRGKSLAGCDFYRCELREALFDATTEFAGGDFRWARFPAGLNLRGKSLVGCDFSYCDLREALFDAATKFAGGEFCRAQLPTGVDLPSS